MAERGRLTLAFCRAAAVFADNRIYERFGSAALSSGYARTVT